MKFSKSVSSSLTFGLIAASLLNEVVAFKPAQVFENTQFTRSIDITGSYVKESVLVEVKNIGDKAESNYYYAVSSALKDRIGVIEGRENKGRVAAVNIERFAEEDEETGTTFYEIVLSTPLEPNEETSIQLGIAYLDRIVPTPEFATQTDPQLFIVDESRFAFSAYHSTKQTLKVLTLGLQVEDLSSDEDIRKEGTSLIYGPYEDVDPYSSEELLIKYENPKPMIKSVKLQRDIWVSHWGASVSFEETYELHNSGTKLKDNSFSRLEYNRRSSSYNLNVAACRIVDIKLPPFAREPFFTDLVGNVSTSNFRQSESESLLQLKPRYPVFGGWNYNFTIGWSADIKYFTKLIGANQYLLKVPLLEGPEDIAYDEVTINIVLPEGAQDVDIAALTPSEPESIHVVKSYLDFFGRPSIQLTYNRVIDNHRRSDIFVTYKFTTVDALTKPAAVSVVFIAFFSFILYFGKLDFGITPRK